MANIILILGIAAILIIGTITADPFVFADKDKKDHKTLDEICAKKQHKNNFKGLFCQYLIELKAAIESLEEHLDEDKDLDDTNELQMLALEGSTLSISGLESSVELPTGSGGALTFYTNSNVCSTISCQVSCNSGDVVTGGGGETTLGSPLTKSIPVGTDAWEVMVLDIDPEEMLNVFAICANTT